jgi:hypothetical protein
MRKVLCLLALFLLASPVRADWEVTKTEPSDQPGNPWRFTPGEGWWRYKLPKASGALSVLNADRASRGLHAYAEDPLLTHAAVAAATFRAERGIEGHTGNDFQFLPAGAYSPAAGCACWANDGSFGACCMHDTQWRYAGAATVIGRDGRAYHHLFVR